MGTKGDMTKKTIQNAAFLLFADQGYRSVAMQDICNKTGLSKGGLYRHYSSKSQIFTDILASLQNEEGERECAAIKNNDSALEVLNDFLSHMAQDLRKDSVNINIALYEFCIDNKMGIGKEIITNQYKQGEATLVSLIEYGISRGEFQTEDPKAVSATILFLMEGLRMCGEVLDIPNQIIDGVFQQIREMVGIKNETGN